MPIRLNRCLSSLLLLACPMLWAAQGTSLQTAKNRIQQLDQHINQLKQTLSSAQDKRSVLHRELAETERQISTGIRKLRNIQTDMAGRQKKINGLQQRVNELNAQLLTQQELLAKHVRIRYQMGEYQAIKWIINQDDPYAISRLLTFHQYLVRSRQQAIDNIAATKTSLTQSQDSLKKEIHTQRALEETLSVNQRNLEQNKRYHTSVISNLNTDIQSREHRLSEARRDRENLSRLLQNLAMQSEVPVVKQGFDQLRHKLPKPVAVDRQDIENVRQGVTFFAGEGTPVHAVYPGKIVFSDWLNGYGLLLIIDHGQGFMTLYAHNQSLFRRKGAMVGQGEQIASVGHSGGIQKNGLYFEVRQRGKAVPPLDWFS